MKPTVKICSILNSKRCKSQTSKCLKTESTSSFSTFRSTIFASSTSRPIYLFNYTKAMTQLNFFGHEIRSVKQWLPLQIKPIRFWSKSSDQTKFYLRTNWKRIRERLLSSCWMMSSMSSFWQIKESSLVCRFSIVQIELRKNCNLIFK